MYISYFFSIKELQVLSILSRDMGSVFSLLPEYVKEEMDFSTILKGLEEKGIVEMQGKTCVVNRVIAGMIRIMMDARKIPIEFEEYAAIYIQEKMTVLLLKDRYSKEKYRLIPFRNVKEFLESDYAEDIAFTEEIYG